MQIFTKKFRYAFISFVLQYSVALRVTLGCLCACVWMSQPVQAQMYMNPYKSLSQFNIDHWDADKGFPAVSVTKVIQTRDNYLWMATFEGLVRFDGANFTLFSTSNTDAFTVNELSCIMQDRKGVLWIGTRGGGIIRYAEGQFRKNGSSALHEATVYCLYEDHKGTIWAGTKGGILQIGNGKVEYIQRKDVPKVAATAIFEDKERNTWIGTQKDGIIVLKKDSLYRIGENEGLSDQRIIGIYQDRSERIWICTETGLFTYQDGKCVPYIFGREIPADTKINGIYEDIQGSLWIATQDGLVRLHKGVLSTLTVLDGIPDHNIQSVCVDQEGSLWVGTYRSGLLRIKEGKFNNFTPRQGLVDDAVNAIIQAKNGDMWIATDRGVSRYHKGNFFNYLKEHGLPNIQVRDVLEDKKGNVWMATYGGLVMYDGRKMTVWDKSKGLSDNQVRRLFIDRKNNLWIGTKRGLNMMTADGKFIIYTTDEGLSSDYITAIGESSDKGLIVGTNGGGINLMKDNQVKVVNVQQGLSANVIFDIYEDKDKVLWIGTNGGITRVERNNYAQVTEQHGLISEKIYQIVEDESGYLWMSCNKGLFKVKKKELSDASIGRIKTVECIVYNKSDGLLTNDIPSNGKLCKTRDSRLVFPTLKGFSMVNPDSMLSNPLRPPVYIEQISLDNISILPGDERLKSVSQQVKRLTIQYTAMSFLAPEKVYFKYKLEPFDADWIEAGTERSAKFTNLAPGTYTFKVMACNNDGEWNTQGTSFQFVVEPYFYQNLWFYYLAGFVIFVVIAVPTYYLASKQSTVSSYQSSVESYH